MAKYELKNRVLQGYLDAISNGNFSDVLNANDLEFDEDGMTEIAFGSSSHGKTFIAEKFSVVLHKDEVVAPAEYDPNKWNKYPDVKPPERVWMRVAQSVGTGLRYTAAIYKNGTWYQRADICGQLFEDAISGVWKFRPWE